ncbi:MAG: hypothetical protein R3C19_01740 [Planctomycetaceae bacterium]
MIQILQTAAGVATPLALLGLVVALCYFAYTRKLKHAESQLNALPEDQRATAIDEYLTRYGIQGKDLTRADRFQLIREEMRKRHQRSTTILIVAAAVFVMCFGLAVFAYLSDSKPDTAGLIEELNRRAERVLKTMNDRKAELQNQQQEGAPADESIAVITQAIDRFELLHQEYIQSIRDNDVKLSHERLGALKDFLNDSRLLSALNLVFQQHYSVRTRLDENGNPVEDRHSTWTQSMTTAGDDMQTRYLAGVPKDAADGRSEGLAVP